MSLIVINTPIWFGVESGCVLQNSYSDILSCSSVSLLLVVCTDYSMRSLCHCLCRVRLDHCSLLWSFLQRLHLQLTWHRNIAYCNCWIAEAWHAVWFIMKSISDKIIIIIVIYYNNKGIYIVQCRDAQVLMCYHSSEDCS